MLLLYNILRQRRRSTAPSVRSPPRYALHHHDEGEGVKRGDNNDNDNDNKFIIMNNLILTIQTEALG